MIYFDTAATTLPKSKKALRAYKKAFQSCGNASRGGHPYAAHASELLYLCRERLAERFGTEPERVVLTMNATHAINLAIKGIIREGDVLISDLEHNAVYRPLYALEAAFLPLRVSPGGAADLLSCTFFLNFLQQDIIY